MGNRLFFGSEGTHEAKILQSLSTKDEAKAKMVTVAPNTCGKKK